MKLSADFNSGGSYLISQANYDRYIAGRDAIGRSDGQFMIPKSQMDELLEQYPNDISAWEDQLGLNHGSLGNAPYRVDVNEPSQYNLRAPDKSLSGANDKFTGTGQTTGGWDEGVVDPFPNPERSPGVGSVSRVAGYGYDMNDPHLFDRAAPGDFTYRETDLGKSASGVLSDQPGERNAYAQRTVGGADRRVDDDGGHLIANRFGGSGGKENLDAQNSNLNRGGYKAMENQWAQDMENGNQIYAHVETYKSDGSDRPDAYMGYYIEEDPNGNRWGETFSFQNESAATQEAWNKELYDNGNSMPGDDYNPMYDDPNFDKDAYLEVMEEEGDFVAPASEVYGKLSAEETSDDEKKTDDEEKSDDEKQTGSEGRTSMGSDEEPSDEETSSEEDSHAPVGSDEEPVNDETEDQSDSRTSAGSDEEPVNDDTEDQSDSRTPAGSDEEPANDETEDQSDGRESVGSDEKPVNDETEEQQDGRQSLGCDEVPDAAPYGDESRQSLADGDEIAAVEEHTGEDSGEDKASEPVAASQKRNAGESNDDGMDM